MPVYKPNSLYSEKANSLRGDIGNWLMNARIGVGPSNPDDEGRLNYLARGIANALPLETGPQDLAMPMQISPVYHGSPYRFNKFKNEAIGSGEGAQAFGYGHYMTESKQIAEEYATKLAPRDRYSITFGGKTLRDLGLENNPKAKKIEEVLLDAVVSTQTGYKSFGLNRDWRRISEEAKKLGLDNPGYKLNSNIYEATLHKGKKPGEYEYLEWSEKVPKELRLKLQNQVLKEYGKQSAQDFGILLSNYSNQTGALRGEELYRALSDVVGIREVAPGKVINERSTKAASEFLKRNGIDGIKYHAGSLSGMKSDKFNYVVFDPEDIAIESVK